LRSASVASCGLDGSYLDKHAALIPRDVNAFHRIDHLVESDRGGRTVVLRNRDGVRILGQERDSQQQHRVHGGRPCPSGWTVLEIHDQELEIVNQENENQTEKTPAAYDRCKIAD